jgi:3-oxoacyl-[acyl-carrier protein] reductase
MTELTGKTALITGAASGIGRATAFALAEAGAKLALFDRAPVAQTIKGFGTTASAWSVDVADEAAVVAAVAQADGQFGGIDILVSAAGIFREAPLLETSLAAFNEVMAVNLAGSFLVGREVARAMKKHGRGGRIVTFSSELATLGRAGYSAYCASKGAIEAMTRTWARELGPDVLVNAIAPGPTDTPLLDWENLPPHWQSAELSNPLGRIGRAEEIAAVIRFLVGPGASFMTGQVVGVNGGAAM